MSTFSTHVLDAVLGRPAAGVDVVLTGPDGSTTTGRTDDDGRWRPDGELPAGDSTLRFATGAWFAAQQRETFHPEVTVAFTATPGEHHHVALLLSPFAYTTYRGS
ncbi:hydroxyisourate hydrolase [Modestobacter roseus]|uniref:5-hydroxyisourate hydrolase n=1 Tax=Modestobacter roseus TaxID=1181884 RepID=A0A562IPY4_9ACTN|nr:hydroxyisourate hydrolase [Modestobacter roseus]MQA34319.1 hydroxyisourate hydrolase [Modestobacter roseus]TWH72962.1 5-hydroxyisourate hydrolase [Modestobacter roseus]